MSGHFGQHMPKSKTDANESEQGYSASTLHRPPIARAVSLASGDAVCTPQQPRTWPGTQQGWSYRGWKQKRVMAWRRKRQLCLLTVWPSSAHLCFPASLVRQRDSQTFSLYQSLNPSLLPPNSVESLWFFHITSPGPRTRTSPPWSGDSCRPPRWTKRCWCARSRRWRPWAPPR